MTEPKRKHSKGRRDRRRWQIKTKVAQTIICPHCKAEKLSHRRCLKCEKY